MGPIANAQQLVPIAASPEITEHLDLSAVQIMLANHPRTLLSGQTIHAGLTVRAQATVKKGSKLYSITHKQALQEDTAYPCALLFNKGSVSADILLDASSPILLSDEAREVGRLEMLPSKVVVTFPDPGHGVTLSAFLFGEVLLTEGSLALNENMRFPETRLDLMEEGSFRIAGLSRNTLNRKDPVRENSSPSMQDGKMGLSAADRKRFRKQAEADEAQFKADVAQTATEQARTALLVAVKEPGTPVRAVLRMAIPGGAGVDMVFKKELKRFGEEGSLRNLQSLFKGISKWAHRPDEQAQLDAEDPRSEHRAEHTGVFLEAAVLHGQPLAILYAGERRVIADEGVAMLVHVPFTKALLGVGLALNLGGRSTLCTLNVDWRFLEGHSTDNFPPAISFGQKRLRKSGMKPTIGQELLFDRFGVRVERKNVMNNQVLLKGRLIYEPSAGEDGPEHMDGYDRPVRQMLDVDGRMSSDAKVWLRFTSSGEQAGTWKDAFGTPGLTIHKTQIKVDLDPTTIPRCPGLSFGPSPDLDYPQVPRAVWGEWHRCAGLGNSENRARIQFHYADQEGVGAHQRHKCRTIQLPVGSTLLWICIQGLLHNAAMPSY